MHQGCSGEENEDLEATESLLRLVKGNHQELHKVWSALGLSATKKKEEEQAISREIDDLFKVRAPLPPKNHLGSCIEADHLIYFEYQRRLTAAIKMKEEIEREIKSLKNMITDLRAVLPDVSTEGQNVRLHFYFFHFYAALSHMHTTHAHAHTTTCCTTGM